jgi:predicted Zn finger-like uncharacterized protein
MIVSCVGCGTKYKVSDDKIGPLGVKVRCPKCRTVFEVKLPEQEKPESLAEKLFGKDVVAGLSSELCPPPEPTPGGEAASQREPAPSPEPSPPSAPVPPAASRAASPQPQGTPAEPAGKTVESPPVKSAFPFKSGEEDPRTLARALVSDILFYNRDGRDRGLAEGKTLAHLGREIARSWDTYKERVGVQTAVETDFFRQAVNEILGEGRTIL